MIGYGNRFRRDDGIGLEVARRFKEVRPKHFKVFFAESDGLDLLNKFRGAPSAVIIDAMRSGRRPGTIVCFKARAGLPRRAFTGFSHAVGLVEAVSLGHLLGVLPEKFFVYGVEGKDFSWGEGLSPSAKAAAGRLVDSLLALSKKL